MSKSETIISIVIPVYNDRLFLQSLLLDTLKCLKERTEIIIVDSSDDPEDFNLLPFRENDLVSFLYFRLPPSYAGKSLNLGINEASSEFIGFLDAKTPPLEDWPYSYIEKIKDRDLDVLFGSTVYDAKDYFQRLLRAASYGTIGHESVPGTVIKASVIKNHKGFVENIRAAYDIEWRERIKEKTIWENSDIPSTSYSSLPKTLVETVKKYFLYSIHTAMVQANNNLKEVYLSLVLVLSALIFPRWNFLIGGWDANPFYIADITKIYLISLIFLGLLLIFINRILPKRQSGQIVQVTVKYLLLFFSIYCVYRWNAVVVGWVESAALYIPHITKTYIVLICLISIFYRGLLLPTRRKEDSQFLFPLRWIKIGFLGFLLDLIKAPGYILGAFVALFRSF